MVIITVIIMVIITVIMVIIMVLCLGISLQGIKMSESQTLGTVQVVRLSSCQVVKFDPWDMLNNFCFHVYAQKSLFKVENVNGFFLTKLLAAPFPVTLPFIELVPS